jgi:flagellar biosynthetic protein FlhB
MAEQGDDADKTEDPTQRRLEQAHEKGDVVKSIEVSTFFTLAAVTLIVAMAGGPAIQGMVAPLAGLIEHADDLAVDAGGLRRLLVMIVLAVGTSMVAPLLLMLVAGVAGNMIQHRLVFSAENLKPKFSKVSPLAGLKRLFSAEALVNFLKGVLKIGLIGGAMTMALWPERDRLDAMVTMDLSSILGLTQTLSVQMLGTMLAIMFVIAAGDFVWQRHRWMTRQKMSLQEIKDEFKQTEGDPIVKGKIKQLRLERSRKRMMAAIPTATVVVTNPTHFAVALKYESGMQAPICVAKGADDVALRIRELAKEHKVTVVENPPLARALFATVEIDEMVPEHHYKAVAEVIGFVMKLKSKKSWRD